MAYASRQELIEWMQLPADTQLQPAELHARSEILDRALDTSKELIDAFCRRNFDHSDVEIRDFYPPYRARAFNVGDIARLVAVSADGRELELVDDYTIRPYVYGKPSAYLVRTEPMVWPQRVTIEAEWGWTDVPAAVKQAALKIGQKIYLTARSTAGVVVVQDTTVQLRMFDNDAYKLLNPYRVAL